jgi:hypothetical protein
MLHRRQLPDPVASDLRRVFDAKLRFLTWLLRNTPATGFAKTELRAALGQSLGDWFAGKIQRGANRTLFGKAVDDLRTLAENDPAGAVSCAEAIEHDALFDVNWNIPGFAMRFSTLPDNWRVAVKPVGEPFYDLWLSNGGFPQGAFGLSVPRLTRNHIMTAFRPQSRGVCSYCDGPLGDVGTDKEASDCDHFFPKSLWPHLAIHPRNLFAACKGCNETWKLDNPPMGAGSVAELNETYHPEQRPGADAITVTANSTGGSGRRLSLSITDGAVPRRAETLNDVLDLESRWSNDVNERLDGQVSELVAESVEQVKRRRTVDQAEMEDIVDTCIYYRNRHKGCNICVLREVAVLEYQRANQIADLLAACC